MRGTLNFSFDKKELQKFDASCEIAIRNIGRGSKRATIQACEEILEASIEQVPKQTLTLMLSAFYEVARRSDTAASSYVYEAIVGYGGNGDPINPKTGRPASSYMVAVHEDLSKKHPNGKAKFLEDPVREYAANKFARTVFTNVQSALAGLSD